MAKKELEKAKTCETVDLEKGESDASENHGGVEDHVG